MLYLSFAAHAQAKPYIRLLSLKRELSARRFELFRSHQAALIVTGAGAMEAAAGAGCLLATVNPEQSVFAHIRVQDAVEGSRITLCNRILSPDGRVFYPDMLFRHPFAEGAGDAPEAAGAFRAASMFLPPHRIFVVRADAAAGCADKAAEALLHWLCPLAAAMPEREPVLDEAETEALVQAGEQLHLSVSMDIQLERLARFCKLRGGRPLPLVKYFAALPCQSIQEGKKRFAELCDKLLEP